MNFHFAATWECASPSSLAVGSMAKGCVIIEYARCSVIFIIKYYHDTINNKEPLIH